MRTRNKDHSEAIGTDAFLDIVANLVGILLILIMVIGVRMDDASSSARIVANLAGPSEEALVMPDLPEITMPDVEPARLELTRVETSIREAQEETAQLEQMMRVQKLDRDNLMLAIAKAEKELERRRETLDESQQQDVQLQLELDQARNLHRSIVDQIEATRIAAENQPPEVIQHVATPLAKTVFVKEEHFRLKSGRLVYVPLNEMTSQLRSEAPKKIWKLKQAKQTTETIGPRDGFYLRYTLRRTRAPQRTERGVAAREMVELDRFVMFPVTEGVGETIPSALQPDSAFFSRLQGWNPRDTIITVWTYPDSFKEFRELKSGLYELGYLTAARPLPEGQMISGSPNGTRSAAQ